MTSSTVTANTADGLILVLGGTGKIGRRVAERLSKMGLPVRVGSRAATPSFDWNNESTWDACLDGVSAVYVSYSPDLAIPGAADAIRSFMERAHASDVERAVLLSGRGEAEAQACEQIVQASGVVSTIVRASWFNQNFSEGAFADMVLGGEIALPASDTPEPFVDADDIADVAVAALTQPGHENELYEVTGPDLLTFADIAKLLSDATGRRIGFTHIPHDEFVDGATEAGAPSDVVWMLDYLFATVLDGRNAHLTDGVERALGRKPKSFAAYAREVAATDAWRTVA